MKAFGENDTIFASATRMGQEIFNIRICGVSSMESLMDAMRQECRRGMGLLNVRLRNMTQGWTQTLALY